MRKIKFRGRNYDGLWIVGYLIPSPKRLNKGNEISICIDPFCLEKYKRDLDYLSKIEVKTETIGQFTGLLDKNGKEIYEGDIIIEKLRRARKDGERLVICFDDFEWQGKNTNGATTSLSLLSTHHTFEVIGNIYDNPELLKGGAE